MIKKKNLTSRCILPTHPESGKWSILGATRKLSPGAPVTSGTVLKLECSEGFRMDGQNLIYCDKNNKWTGELGRCLSIPSADQRSFVVFMLSF